MFVSEPYHLVEVVYFFEVDGERERESVVLR